MEHGKDHGHFDNFGMTKCVKYSEDYSGEDTDENKRRFVF
jgi:hypothetical protein